MITFEGDDSDTNAYCDIAPYIYYRPLYLCQP